MTDEADGPNLRWLAYLDTEINGPYQGTALDGPLAGRHIEANRMFLRCFRPRAHYHWCCGSWRHDGPDPWQT